MGAGRRLCSETNRASVLKTYADAVSAAGNMPLALQAETNRAAVARLLASLDALLLCGGGDTHQARRFRTMPVYAVHGGADKVLLEHFFKHRKNDALRAKSAD